MLNLIVVFDGVLCIVMLLGSVVDFDMKVKVKVVVGNVQGVVGVNDDDLQLDDLEVQYYDVKLGDMLLVIVKEVYGDVNKYLVIFEVNKLMLLSLDWIYLGQKFVILLQF